LNIKHNRRIKSAYTIFLVVLMLSSLVFFVNANSQDYIDEHYVDPHKTVIGSFESGETWVHQGSEGALEYDTAHFKEGNQGLKLVSWNSSSAYYTEAVRSANLDLSDRIIRTWVYIDDTSNLGGLAFILDTSSGLSASFYCTTAYLKTGWNLIGLPNSLNFNDFDLWIKYAGWDDAYLSSVTAERIRVWSTTDNVNVSVTVDDWLAFAYSELYPNGVVTLTFDDGYYTTYNMSMPMMDAYNYKGVSAIITNNVGASGYMDWSEIQALVDDGWDVCSHGVNHVYMTSQSLETMDYELSASQEALDGNLTDNKGSRFWVEPYNDWNETVRTEVQKYYHMACLGQSKLSTIPPADMYNVVRYATGNWTSLKAVTDLIDNATTYRTWLILNMHIITTGDTSQSTYMSNSTFADILSYIQSSGIAVKTFSEVYDDLISDSEPPTFEEITADTTVRNKSATLSCVIDDNIMVSHYVFSVNGVNGSAMEFSSNPATFGTTWPDVEGEVVPVIVYANDTSGNWAASAQWNFTIQYDPSLPPSPGNITDTDRRAGCKNSVQVAWDNLGIGASDFSPAFIFSSNATGIWQNSTATPFTSNISYGTIINPSANEIVGCKIYAYNSNGLWAESDLLEYMVLDAPPSTIDTTTPFKVLVNSLDLGSIKRGATVSFEIELTWFGVNEVTMQSVETSGQNWTSITTTLPQTFIRQIRSANGTATLTFNLTVPESAGLGEQRIHFTFKVTSVGSASSVSSVAVTTTFVRFTVVEEKGVWPSQEDIILIVVFLLGVAIVGAVVGAIKRRRGKPVKTN
jgi:peptidoglycan/xylan/chitin deacetylase (PgdA/CDA1 family)